ncbi:hypothetical protein ABZ883_26385 [Streptomyces sp. NPDC046977]|uniref:hypothetical protein n=1 Tax=Streptomyces sp. NPDC046977 TaxID=3154703 RepID=UPI0033C2A105
MRIRTATAAATLLLAPLTAACSSSEPDVAACKTAMVQQLKDAAGAQPAGGRPAACAGVDGKTLERLAGEAMEIWVKSPEASKAVEDKFNSAFPSAPADALDITPDCRTWIESELQDNSSTLDATAGQDACGYLTTDEMDKAIDQVTNDLMGKG